MMATRGRPCATDRRDYLVGVRLNRQEKECLDQLMERMEIDNPATVVRVLLCNVKSEQAKAFVGR
jgi:hypothetical protein